MCDVQAYWCNPTDAINQPQEYAKYTRRSDFLLSILPNYVLKHESILELGCNCGRNLNALYLAGYYYLGGVEINGAALHYGSLIYPTLYSIAEISSESIETFMKKDAVLYDCIFTMAVLEHLPESSEWVFYNIAHMAQSHLITIEDENSGSPKHFPRNYKEIFEKLGWRQILEKQATKSDELEGITARVFVRKV